MKKALIGAGGSSAEVKAQIGNFDMMCFVDDEYYIPNSKNIRPMSELDVNEYEILVCMGSSIDRERIVNSLPTNTRFFTFIHPSVLIMENNVTIGEGSFVGAYSVLTTNIKIGKHSILSRACHIGHDVITGDYLSMMPGSVVSGNCNIGNRVYIGTNSSIREKLNICDDVILGLNSGVVKSINEPGIYGGTPAKNI